MGVVLEFKPRTGQDPGQNRLRHLRGAMGLTQRDLAAKVGVEPGTVRRWEVGQEPIPFKARGRLADVFGVSVDHLMGIEPEWEFPGVG